MLTLNHIVEGLLPQWPALTRDTRTVVSAHCAAFVVQQIALSPFHIRIAIRTVLVVFVGFVYLSNGFTSLSALPPWRRSQLLATFASAGIRPFVALERVLRSMALVAFLEHPEVIIASRNSIAHRDLTDTVTPAV